MASPLLLPRVKSLPGRRPPVTTPTAGRPGAGSGPATRSDVRPTSGAQNWPRPNLRRLAGSAFSVGACARSAPSFPPLWAARSSKRPIQSGSGGRPSVARRTSGEGCSLRARGRKSTLRLSSLIGPGGQSRGMCAGRRRGTCSRAREPWVFEV